MVGSARLEAVLHLAECGIAVVPAHHPVAVIGEGLTGCSCGRQSCPAAGRHPMGALAAADVTVDAGVLGYWWGCSGPGSWCQANVATMAGASVDVVELAYPGDWAAVLAWLRGHGLGDSPAFEVGAGLLRLVATVGRREQAVTESLAWGRVGRLEHGELVLLPPSVQPGGRGLVWLRAPEPKVALPDGERLFAALKALPPPDELAAWVQEQSGSLAVR